MVTFIIPRNNGISSTSQIQDILAIISNCRKSTCTVPNSPSLIRCKILKSTIPCFSSKVASQSKTTKRAKRQIGFTSGFRRCGQIFLVNLHYWCNRPANRKCVRSRSICCQNLDSIAIKYTHHKWLTSIRTSTYNREISNYRTGGANFTQIYTGTFISCTIPRYFVSLSSCSLKS